MSSGHTTSQVKVLIFLLWLSELLNVASTVQEEKAMAPHSSTFAWKIPWTEEPGIVKAMVFPVVMYGSLTLFKKLFILIGG